MPAIGRGNPCTGGEQVASVAVVESSTVDGDVQSVGKIEVGSEGLVAGDVLIECYPERYAFGFVVVYQLAYPAVGAPAINKCSVVIIRNAEGRMVWLIGSLTCRYAVVAHVAAHVELAVEECDVGQVVP